MLKILFSLLCSFLLLSANAQVNYDVFVSSRGSNSVKWYDTLGNYLGDFVASGSGGLSSTEDILFHPNGTVLVTGYNNTAIKQYDGSNGSFLGDFTTGYSLENPSKMSLGYDSLIYVTQWGSTQQRVVRFDLQGNFVDEFTAVNVANGLGHVWDDSLNFYIAQYADGAIGTIHKFDSAGNDLGTFINSSILQGPTSIWWDENGDMLVEDWSAGLVLRYDSTGTYKGVFLNGITSPEGIAFLPNGDGLIGDWGQDAVHRFDTAGNNLGYFASGFGLTDPNSVKIRETFITSLNEENQETDFSLYPTIGSGPFTLELKTDETINISVMASNGQAVYRTTIDGSSNTNHIWNPSKQIATGDYWVTMSTDKTTSSRRLILAR